MAKYNIRFPSHKDIETQFWARVAVAGPDECWEWQDHFTYGYGKFCYHHKTYRSHRLAYELTYGPIPEGMLVCHHCDNRACCNPSHLFLGSQLDNMHDFFEKGRTRAYTGIQGEKHPKAKLTDEQVI